jgi:hypothetical protein
VRSCSQRCQHQVSREGGLSGQRESPPGTRVPGNYPRGMAVWRPYPAVLPCPSVCSGLGGRPPTGARCCRLGEIISRGHNGRSGWFWRFQLHPMRPGDNSRRLGHVGWAQGTP